MKAFLSIALSVSICGLLTSKGMAADAAKPALFTIVSAQYGTGDQWSDVSDKVKAAVQNDALLIDPAKDNFGDSIGGAKKTLKVVVKYDGKEFAFRAGPEGTAGNYLVFRNQTAGEFAIFPHCTSPSRIAINGIQIVAGERAISINFTALSDASAVLGSDDAAGVIPRANWNNIQYNDNTYGFNPKDDTGTTLESTFVNCRLKSGYPGNHGYTPTVGNDRLMKYFCGNDEGGDSKSLPLIRVSGLPASFSATGYSIYVYSDFNNNSDPHQVELGTSLLDANNPSAGISTVTTATIVDSDDWPGSGGGTFTEGATLTINKAVLDAMVKAAGDPAKQILAAKEVLALTGAETRIVWLRHKEWGGRPTDHLDGGAGYSIMAFDTEGKGERELVPEGEFYNPLIAPSGERVIYSAKTDGKLQIHCVDWNGANSRVLSDGFALWPWRDPATGIEWVYAGNDRYGAFVERFQIDKPEVKERLYTGPMSPRLAVSADGTRAAGEFPWPSTGMLYFRTGQVDRKNYHDGCNTYMSPDNSYMVTTMDGGHSQVTLYKSDGSSRDISVVPPGLKKKKDGGNGCMWNPKWASDARHMSVAGPFRNLGPDRADIWLGQFADDFNSIAKWVQVTDNDYMDNYAYVWVGTKERTLGAGL